MTGRTAQVVAATWVCRRGDAVLAVRPRGADVYFLPGGTPEPGETLAQAAAREVNEEVGISVDPALLTEVARVEAPAYGRPDTTVLLVCFEGPGKGSPIPDGTEIVEVAWLAPSGWTAFAPAVRQALDLLGR